MWFLLSVLSLSRELKQCKQLTWGGGQVIKNAPSGLPVNLNPSKERKLITWEKLTGLYVWGEDVGEPIICRTKIWLSFSSRIETDMYSGAKIHVIKFAKGIDYVSCVFFPQEEAVMAWTSKTDVKSDCPSFLLSHVQISYATYIYWLFTDVWFQKNALVIFKETQNVWCWNYSIKKIDYMTGEDKHIRWKHI